MRHFFLLLFQCAFLVIPVESEYNSDGGDASSQHPGWAGSTEQQFFWTFGIFFDLLGLTCLIFIWYTAKRNEVLRSTSVQSFSPMFFGNFCFLSGTLITYTTNLMSHVVLADYNQCFEPGTSPHRIFPGAYYPITSRLLGPRGFEDLRDMYKNPSEFVHVIPETDSDTFPINFFEKEKWRAIYGGSLPLDKVMSRIESDLYFQEDFYALSSHLKTDRSGYGGWDRLVTRIQQLGDGSWRNRPALIAPIFEDFIEVGYIWIDGSNGTKPY